MPITLRKRQQESAMTSQSAASSSPDVRGRAGPPPVAKKPPASGVRSAWNRQARQDRGRAPRNARERKKSGKGSEDSSSSSERSSSSSSDSTTSSSSSDDDDDDDDDVKPQPRESPDQPKAQEAPPASPARRRTKDLAGFFATQTAESKPAPRRKRIELAEAPGTIVLENEPERLEGVVRSDDPGEWEKPIEIEKGRAKLIANLLQSKKDEEPRPKRRPFRLDVERGDPVVLENQPVQLEGVVRSGEQQETEEEDVIKQRGRIRSIAERWKRAEQQQQQQLGSDDEDEEDENSPDDQPKKPAWLVELEKAKESGVYETESCPIVRDDVVRAEDDQPDVISFQRTRNLRKMWTEIEQEKLHTEKQKQEEEKAMMKKAPTKTATSSSESSESEEESSSDEDTDDDEEQPTRGDLGQVTGVRRALQGQGQRTKDSYELGTGCESPSAARAVLFVNNASLKYEPKN